MRQDCKIYNYDMLYLISNTQMSHSESFNVTYDIEYSKEDLNKLEARLIQLPKVLDNNEFKLARISLDDTEDLLNSIANRRL